MTSTLRCAGVRAWVWAVVLWCGIGGPDGARGYAATSGGAGLQPQEVIEGVEAFTLRNGLQVLLVPEPSQAKVTVEVVYRVGSRHEGAGETGMAHLLEHMLFKGSSRYGDHRTAFQEHGADFNAETSVDHTVYYETLLATPDNLRFALDLEADRMLSARLSDRELQSEFSVVRNELEIGENSPHEVLLQRLLRVAYAWHGYGRDTIGSRSDIERVPIDRLRVFYRQYYQPDNATLIVAGGFDRAAALRHIGSLFGSLPRPSRKLHPTYTVEPVQDGERGATVRRVGDVQVVGVAYHGVAAADPEFAAAEAAVDVLTHEATGRVYRALVETKQATGLKAEATRTAEPGTVEVLLDVPKAQPIEPVRDRLLTIIEGLGRGPIEDAELRRFKSSARKNFGRISAQPQLLAADLAAWVAVGDWRLRYLHRDRVQALTPDAVAAFARRFLLSSNRSVGLFLPTADPQRSPLPAPPQLAQALQGYKGQAPPVPGEAFAANFDNIEARVVRSTLNIGMKLALLPKRSRGQTVQLALSLRAGSRAALRGRAALLELLGPMLSRGTRLHTYEQLNDALDDLDTALDVPEASILGGHGLTSNFALETTRQNLPAVLRLLTEILRQPSFPAGQLDIVRKELTTDLEASLQQPISLAAVALMRRLFPYASDDMLYHPTLPERIARLATVRADDLQAFHREYFGAQEGELSLVGDFDPVETRAHIDSLLGGFRAQKPYERPTAVHRPHDGGEEIIRVPDKQGAVVLAAQRLAIRDDDPDMAALSLFSFLFGGHENSRLNTRLREQAGLAYSVTSQVDASPHERNGSFLLFFTCAPQNARPGLALLEKELTDFWTHGPTENELRAMQRAYQKAVEGELANDAALAGLLNARMEFSRTLRFDQTRLQTVLQLSPKEVLEAVRRHIDPARLYKVLAGSLP